MVIKSRRSITAPLVLIKNSKTNAKSKTQRTIAYFVWVR